MLSVAVCNHFSPTGGSQQHFNHHPDVSIRILARNLKDDR